MSNWVYYLSYFMEQEGFLFPYELPDYYYAPGLFLIQSRETGMFPFQFSFPVMDNGVRRVLTLERAERKSDFHPYFFVTTKNYGKFIFKLQAINPQFNKYLGTDKSLRKQTPFWILYPANNNKLEKVCRKFNFYFIGYAGQEKDMNRKQGTDEVNHESVKTWGEKSTFCYTGNVTEGTTITYGRWFKVHVSGEQYDRLRREFLNKTIKVGTSRIPPEGSMGAWLRENVTKTAIASYVSAVLLNENFAVRVTKTEIMIVR